MMQIFSIYQKLCHQRSGDASIAIITKLQWCHEKNDTPWLLIRNVQKFR